jgi:hypothetical protein
MLCVARQARTAYSNSPAQNRRCVTGQNLRSWYTDTMVGWLDAQGTNLTLNQTSAFWNDSGYNEPYSVFTWQSTAFTSAQYPLNAVNSNVKCVQFDGIDDIIQTGNNLLLNVQAITVVALYRNFSASNAVVIEGSSLYTAVTTGFLLSSSSTNATSSLRGDVGYSTRTWSASQTPWTCVATVMDKSAGLGSEILAYQNGTQITSFTTSVNSDNTNTFISQVPRVGRSYNGTLPMSGVVACIMVFNRKLSTFEIQQVTQQMRWRAGLSS